MREEALAGSNEGLSLVDIASTVATGCPLEVGMVGMLRILGWLSRHSNWHGVLHAPKTLSSVLGIQ